MTGRREGPRARAALATLAVLAAALAAGCGGGGSKTTGPTGGGARTASNFDFGSNDARRASAFGDSITLGVTFTNTVTSNNYPNNLQAMLRGQDSAWRVVNRGVGGERTAQGARRLPSVLAADHPGFALIMEGTNDATEEDDPGFIVSNLDSMVSQAQGNQTIPVIGTIPPNFRNDPGARSIVDAANRMIRTLATTRRIVLAEIFNGMNDRSLFGVPDKDIDPLHPNEQGYVTMAGIWFDAMQRAIPAGSGTTTSAARARRR
jgi:lysophospholipase L1-like esterase